MRARRLCGAVIGRGKDCGIPNARTPRIHRPSPGTRLEIPDARRTRMLTIRNIMSKSVYVVDAEASAEEAAWGLTRRHIGGAPARDAQGNLVGVLSSSDLVNPEPAQWIRGEATVADLMNPDVISLYADDPAMAAVNEMAKRDIHRIVVLDAEGKLAGIVTPMDVVRALADGRSFDLAD
jgi:CBS-domain-containing membrane protein